MNKTKKLSLIIATLSATTLVALGLILLVFALCLVSWDFRKLSAVEYTTTSTTLEFSYTNVKITTDTTDVIILPSEDGKTSVSSFKQKDSPCSVAVNEGTLVIDTNSSTQWYKLPFFNFNSPTVTLYLPATNFVDMTIESTTGDVHVKNVTVNNLNLKATTGDIKVTDVTCTNDAKIDVSTGDVMFIDFVANNLTSTGTTGDATLQNVLIADTINVIRKTGDIKLNGCDATEISIKATTGDVKCSLLSGKIFIVSTKTGDKKVPNSSGTNTCTVTTSTGDITISIL